MTRAPATVADRFAAALDRLHPAGEPLGLAVSGGPDSLGLLALALDAGQPLAVATIDHGLRPDSAAEAAGVAALCASLGVEHAVLHPDRPIADRNVQAGARRARYDALARWAATRGLAAVATGHHREDAAETLALRLARGSGLHGLAGLRPRLDWCGDGPPLPIIRPCLALSRSDLRRVVDDAVWAVVDDPANTDERFDRARMRRRLPPSATPGLARSAHALGEAADALAWAEERAAALALTEADGVVMIRPAGLPSALLRALLARTVQRLAPGAVAPTGPEGDRLLGTLAAGGTATLRGLRWQGGPVWHVRVQPIARGQAGPILHSGLSQADHP